jgi:hypothetical protein
VEEQYVNSADAFNGYLRGEWEFDPTMGDGVPTEGGMREAPEPTKEQLEAEGRIAPEGVIDKGTPLPAPKEGNLGSLLAGLEAGNEEDEAKLAEILEQRKAIRDRKRSSSGVRAPGAIQVGDKLREAMAEAEGGAVEADNFERTFPTLMKLEGGFQNMPEDKGNFYKGENVGTNLGISGAQYERLFGEAPTEEKMRALTPEKVKAVYKEKYWDANKVGEMPTDLQEMVFNMFVMTSPKNVVKAIQRASGAKEDGIMGPQTLKAMRGVSKEEIWEEYHKYLKSLKSYSKFGKGWQNRYKELLDA